MHFELYQSFSLKGRRWRWRLRAANGRIVAQGEDYHNRADAEHAIGLIRRSASAPTRLRGEGHP